MSVPQCLLHLQVKGVLEVQDLHVWGLKPGVPLLAAHLVVRPSANPQAVLDAATKTCQRLNISHSTIQVGWPCSVHCLGLAEWLVSTSLLAVVWPLRACWCLLRA